MPILGNGGSEAPGRARANPVGFSLRLQNRLPAQLMHNRLSSIAEAKLSDELANQAIGGFKNLFEKSFEKGVAQILEVRIILTCALVGVA